MFDLLSALLDSWSLWNKIAGNEVVGVEWRTRYLQLTYQAGSYRPVEGHVRAAAKDVGLTSEHADELIRRWCEIQPWPETRQVLRVLTGKVPVAVATNASITLAKIAIGILDVPIPIVITAEEAGFYKPHPSPYRIALSRMQCTAASVLYVAGSATDVPGANAVGMSVFWHNRRRLPLDDASEQPKYVSDCLWPVLELV